jgi:hypothetical protein
MLRDWELVIWVHTIGAVLRILRLNHIFSIFSMGTTTMRVSQTHSKCEELGLFNYFSITFFKGWVDEIDILMIVFI